MTENPENPNQIPKPPGTSVDRPSIPVKDEFPRDGGLVSGEVVLNGGIAESDEQVEEITRDTYGFPDSPPTAPTREERIEEANRAAEEAGMPGVDLPDEEH